MTKKIRLFIIILTVISLIPISLALDFSLDSPDSVNQDEEFIVTINSNETDTYDVKIFVEDPSSSPKTISQIFNEDEEKYQNSYFYLKEIFPQQSEFKIKITKAGNWEICARLRKSSPSFPICNPITVEENQNEETQEENEEAEQDAEEEQDNEEIEQNIEEENTTQPEDTSKEESEKQLENPTISPTSQEPIFLNQKIEENPKASQVLRTKQEKILLYIVYAFTLFTIIIIILLALKKL